VLVGAERSPADATGYSRRGRDRRPFVPSALTIQIHYGYSFDSRSCHFETCWSFLAALSTMTFRSLLLPVAPVLLLGCLERDDATAPSTGSGRVRVVHVAPTVGTLAVTRLGGELAASLSFGAVAPATGATTSPAGPGVLTIRDVTGNTTLYNEQAPIARDAGTTIVLLGNVGSGFAAGSARSFQPIVLRDTVASPASGAWLRLVHAADSVAVTGTTPTVSSGVDIYVYPQGTARPTAAPVAGAALRLINASYRTVTAYLPLTNAGAYQVEVFVTGAAPATAVPLVSTTIALTNASKTTVIARRAQPGATAAPLNAFGFVVLAEP
jgi:hypothetical protein